MTTEEFRNWANENTPAISGSIEFVELNGQVLALQSEKEMKAEYKSIEDRFLSALVDSKPTARKSKVNFK